MYKMCEELPHDYFVWTTLPYGYTRAPFIARALIKPLVASWRRLNASVIAFYDDGMAVSDSCSYLERLSLQIHCDLLRAGLVPGANKCIWKPTKIVDWNGLRFDFEFYGMSVLPRRVQDTLLTITNIMSSFPAVTVRDIARCVGKLMSFKPVFGGVVLIRTKMLQTFVNIRHFRNMKWDDFIVADNAPLFVAAYEELEFWLANLVL